MQKHGLELTYFPGMPSQGIFQPLMIMKILNPFSKHGKKYEEYLKSDEWKRIRNARVEEANGICDKCHWPLKGRVPHVHHSSYDNFGYEGFEDTKVEHECCHEREHGIKVRGDD